MACIAPAPEAAGVSQVPQRVVSLDYCADQYVLGLADRAQIAALSVDSTRDFAWQSAKAQGLPQVRATAEDILALRPDLVVRSYGGGPQLEGQLARLGIKVYQIGFGEAVGDIESNILGAAQALGSSSRGEDLVRSLRQRLAAVPKASGQALYLTAAGFTTGSGSLPDAMIQAAGLSNLEQTPGWRSVPLEQLASFKPDVVVTAFFDAEATRQDRWSPSRHPVVQRALANAHTVHLGAAMTACNGWWLADGAEAVSAAARARPPQP